MATNGPPQKAGERETSLEKIKRQLASGSGRNLLQGPLLKRSETIRKWNERWVILDPTTGKMEYKMKRTDATVKGTISFDANSTITLSPMNIHGLPKYEGCCFYIGMPQKKDYFFCAETPGAAKAWVSTLHATQLVLKAHKEAVKNLSGSGGAANSGTVATVVAAANSAAQESSKEIEAAMQISMRNALGVLTNKVNDEQMDDLTIMKETLLVKDEELHNLAREVRARESTIKEITEKLCDTAEAAEAAASAARKMDEQRRMACAEIERLRDDTAKQLKSLVLKVNEYEEKITALNQEMEQVKKHRDSGIQEAHLWRSELAKARDQVVILEAAALRAEERARVCVADAETRLKDAAHTASIATNDKQELLSYINILQAQLQRQKVESSEVFEEKSLSEDKLDKECLSESRVIPMSVIDTNQSNRGPIPDSGWNDIPATESRIEDVREIGPQTEGSCLDIAVIQSPDNLHTSNG